MNAEQKDLMLRLADLIESLPPHRFDLGSFYRHAGPLVVEGKSPDPIHDCGTVACAIGWLPAICPAVRPDINTFRSGCFRIEGYPQTMHGFQVACRIFGISYDESESLFDGSGYEDWMDENDGRADLTSPPASVVAAKMRAFAEQACPAA